MLKQLKFVQGAVAKKDFLPAMTHFCIENGTVRSYNGTLALCAPLPFDVDCKPKAVPLVQAISRCGDSETPVLSMTPAGRLSIKSGSFKAFIDCVEGETPHVVPDGERVDFDGEALLKAFKTIFPFIGDDASRPWSSGVLLRGQSAFATCNVALVEYWIGVQTPIVVNIPRIAIVEMLRIDEPPTYAQVTPTSISFHYPDGRWIRSQLLDVKWPEIENILNVESNAVDLDENIFEGLDAVKPFADKMGRVFIKDGVLSTHTEPTEGATYTFAPGAQFEGVYAIEILKLLKGVAKTIDWSTYPRPCMFFGDRLRGAIIGMRM